MVKAAILNTTAYRVYQMLHWLCEKPHSVEEFNARFEADPLIEKSVSEDSIWLYISTLKLLGCDIARPTPTNGYRYELRYHPFGLCMTQGDLERLARVKMLAEDHLSYPDILHLDQFFKKALLHASDMDGQPLQEALFNQSRSTDYENRLKDIDALQESIERAQLLCITYDSPEHGKERFCFLPEVLSYRRGRLYVEGSRPDRSHVVSLSLESIRDFSPHDNPQLQQTLVQSQNSQPLIVFKVFDITPQQYVPMGFRESISLVSETPAVIRVSATTRDFFLLKQRLLESGYLFEIESPDSFRDEIHHSLMTMTRMYDTPFA